MILLDPNNYSDGVAFFRDMHKQVLHSCVELETLLKDAETRGVFKSFATQPEWEELFRFFTVLAPEHERDEERYLFPFVIAKVPHVGFQPPNAPIRFLIEGHTVLEQKLRALVKDWEIFRAKPHDPAALEASHAQHAAEDAAFIALGKELAILYREHVRIEEQRVYSVADQVLSNSDKLELIEKLRRGHDNEATTPLLEFEHPQFSDPSRNVQSSTNAQATTSFNYEEDDEEGSDLYEL
ncbi:MAG: hemerythrin domain-containing protein [Bacteroidota bacterium]|nr:hemerythrin domain-containing protein [Bacteroidota bacterium]MDP4233054.1 hemerythrin domain-containing protein [Bacteroidota bacterium]MDP4241801.1 hemerythrin domain-containing protein [Bacteroidota bacterium]MDP4288778.1 hemerythrin domain-containing protein [Bacteroidota bacterium]